MSKLSLNLSAAAVAVAAVVAAGGAQAGMTPVAPGGAPHVQRVDCAVGFHLGPAGACIIGTPDPVEHDRVIERRSSDEGCQTRSVKRSDAEGNTETRTATNCN